MLDLLDAGLASPAVGVFTGRADGASVGPHRGLNLAVHVEDDHDRVTGNRGMLTSALGVQRLAFAQQVHGAGVAVVGQEQRNRHEVTGGLRGVDALVTTARRVGLVVMAADCLPVLLADADAGVVGAAHAGRQGLASGVLQETVRVMRAQGASRLTAVIGPSVCGACYEVPAALADEVEQTVPGSRAMTRTGTPSLDLVAGAQGLLRAAGVATVSRAGGCTLEQPDRYYSFRRDGLTGRHAGVVWLT